METTNKTAAEIAAEMTAADNLVCAVSAKLEALNLTSEELAVCGEAGEVIRRMRLQVRRLEQGKRVEALYERVVAALGPLHRKVDIEFDMTAVKVTPRYQRASGRRAQEYYGYYLSARDMVMVHPDLAALVVDESRVYSFRLKPAA